MPCYVSPVFVAGVFFYVVQMKIGVAQVSWTLRQERTILTEAEDGTDDYDWLTRFCTFVAVTIRLLTLHRL